MRKTVLVVVLLGCVATAAQQSDSPAPPKQSQQSAGPENASPQKKTRTDATRDEHFSSAVADALMSRIAQGLVRKNPRAFLSAFDASHLDGYALFADRATATLDQAGAFRAYFHVLDATEQDGKGSATVDVQVERSPQVSGAAPQRSQARMRIECERGTSGWRIVRFTPPDFFSKL